MNEDQENQFQHIKSLFLHARYDEGRTLITKMIHMHPTNSMLYINRALFCSQLGEDDLGKQDLQKAMQLNPYNYLAYFNLFSIQMKTNNSTQAYNNLCCALSCMYLLKAKQQKNVDFAEKSIQYSPNNIAAQLLIQNLKQQCQQTLHGLSTKKANTYPHYKRIEELLHGINKKRLQSYAETTCQIDLAEQIRLKISQFNKLYGQLNRSFGTQTSKVSRQQLTTNNTETFVKQKSKASTSNRQSVIAILEDQDYFNTKSKSTEIKMKYSNQTNPEYVEPNSKDSAQFLLYESHLQASRIPSTIQEHQNQDDQKQHLSKPPKSANRHLIYQSSHPKKLKMSVLSFTFFDNPFPVPKNVYCVISYNESLFVRTHLVDCQQDTCRWNERLDAIDVTPEPALMRLKLYDKTFNSVRDDFIGEIEFIVDVADLLKLPVYNQYSDLIGQIMLHLQLCQVEGYTQ